MQRHLIIAPKSDLEFAHSELQRIVNAGFTTCRLLIDNVTLRAVVDALDDPYDVVWFIAHGGNEGIQLEDGVLSPSLLIQLLRPHPPLLLVLNTCSSLGMGMRAHRALRCTVISTLIDIPDVLAFVTAASLAQALARGLSIPEAYDLSRPDENREYVMLNGAISMNSKSKHDDTNRLLARLYMQIDELQEQVEEVKASVQRPTFSKLVYALAWVFLLGPSLFFLKLRTLAAVLDSTQFLWTVLAWTVAAVLFGYAQGLFKEKSQ
jgi:hypothetical protein